MAIDAFALSRIYAQGWNAAKTLIAGGKTGNAARLNPYRAVSESTRWTEGFEAAIRSRAGSANARWTKSPLPRTGTAAALRTHE
jgi:hypothetical protein